MIDEMFDRHYQSARHEMNDGIVARLKALGGMVRESFQVLHRIEWAAPWADQPPGVHRS